MILGIGTINDETQVLPSKDTQMLLQEILVICMGVSVPWMLVFKPLLLRSKHNREMEARQYQQNDIESPASGGGYGQLLDDHGDEDEEEKYQAESPKKAAGGGGHGHGDGVTEEGSGR